ncbi:hypothetical protein GGU10DRAFT_329641 [Lentinula aff. detonsa]|uniref:Uncharacterized protein n=1 Tax=Lentinula aff. detonsa TaxID=2804958 RepID=A0AA38NRS1_9AGAR|nr:hypothetical protein GGU10DRAFT_329641 [Lentinula aff. detonsa]
MVLHRCCARPFTCLLTSLLFLNVLTMMMLVVKQARKHVGSLLATQTFNSELYTDSFTRGCIRSNSSNSASFTKTYALAGASLMSSRSIGRMTAKESYHYQNIGYQEQQLISGIQAHTLSTQEPHSNVRYAGGNVGRPLTQPTSIPVHSPESFGRKHCNPDICYIWVHNFAYILSALELPFLSTVANPCVILLP